MKKAIIFVVFFILTFLLTSYSFFLPQHWDAFSNLVPAAIYSMENDFTPFTPYNQGHPPFAFISLAIIFGLFGYSLLASHLYVILLAFLSVFFTYLIAEHLSKSTYVGILAASLFLFSPLFIGQAGVVNLAFPLTALSLMSIYFFLKNNKISFLISSLLLAWTMENGVFLLAGLLFLPSVKSIRRHDFKKLLFYSIPFLFYLLWLLLHKLYYGSFFNLEHTNKLIEISVLSKLLQLFYALQIIFLDQYKWVLLLLIFVSVISFKKRTKLLIPLIISFLCFLLLFNAPFFTSFFSIRYMDSFLLELKNYSLIFSILLFLLLVYKERFYEMNIKSNINLIPVFLALFLLVSATMVMPRYIFPLFPLFFIISAISINNFFKRLSFIPVMFVIILFFTLWSGQNNIDLGNDLEYNKEHADMVLSHQQATKFIEENYPDSVILVSGFPQNKEIVYPYGGYVSNPLNMVFKEEDYTKEGFEKVDLFYYSPQSSNIKYPSYFEDNFNLTLIKKFEVNGKTAYVFKV